MGPGWGGGGAGGDLSGKGEGTRAETPRGSVACLQECIAGNWLAAICKKTIIWTGKLKRFILQETSQSNVLGSRGGEANNKGILGKERKK